MNTDQTVVLIDDDELILTILKRVFAKYKVKAYSEVSDAFKDSIFEKCEVVVLDVNLRDESGIDVLIKIKKINKNTPVILMTGSNDIALAASAIKFEADDLILKPFSHEQMLHSVERALRNKELKEQNETLFVELQEKNVKLEELNAQAQIRNSKIDNDLDMASNLQDCLYPKELPAIDKIKIAARSLSVEKISGDFYYFEKKSETEFALIFADVSGHGVTAALFSAMVKVAFSTINFFDYSPAQVIKKINDFLIYSQKKPSYNYLTICYTYFDLKQQTLRYCNAGLPFPVLVKGNGQLQSLETTGPFVGIFDIASFKETELHFSPNDKLVFFTDGAYENTENFNIRKGYDKLLQLIDKSKDRSIYEIIAFIYQSFEETDRNDDATCLGIEFSP